MLTRLGRRWPALLTAAVVAAVLVGSVGVYMIAAKRGMRALCAQLSDSAGLYAGNSVNIRGVPVGTVTAVRPGDEYVTVTMRVADRQLDPSMKVVAVNNSVLADRRLELVGADARGGGELAANDCIPLTRTYTPISVSTAFQSFTTMFDELGGSGADSKSPLGNLIASTNRQVAGTGPEINRIIANTAGFMSDPDEFLAQMRGLFDNLAVLTDVATENWDALKDMGVNAADLTHLMGSQFESFATIFIGLGEAGPGLDDLLGNVLPPMLKLGQANKPLLDAGMKRMDDLKAILRELPGITKAMEASMTRKVGAFRVTVDAPRVMAKTTDSATLCRAMNAADPGSCDPRSPRAAEVDLGNLVTRAIQGVVR